MTAANLPSQGQHQAMSELRDVARLTAGGVEVVEVHDRQDEQGYLRIVLRVDCTGEETWRPAVELCDEESVSVLVPSGYPLQLPYVVTDHRRFAGLPHVVWGTTICLHLSANDWDPGRGMEGLIERLLSWFRHVAEGTITGPDLVWDPPITDNSRTPELLVVQPDLPFSLEDDDELWTGWAVVEATGSSSYEVRRWLDVSESPEEAASVGNRSFLAPIVALPEPVEFSYPEQFGELLLVVQGQGLPDLWIQELLDTAGRAARRMWSAAHALDVRPLPLVLLGTPAPRHAAGRSRVAHLAAWSVDVASLAEATADMPITWMTVYDQRPRVTTRRDKFRPSGWLTGKRVLVLGCGALGAPIAEFCARAGAAEISLVDSGWVKPGILVRQPYFLDEIGFPKALVLQHRLERMSPDVNVVGTWPIDAVAFIIDEPDMSDVDLIVDATASPSVAAALEKVRWTNRGPRPPLLSVMVGHRCERAAATLALPEASGAGVDILRRLAVAASDDERLFDLLDDFHPDLPRTEVFQPEPGCSDPTFVGSAADLASFAGHLLNDALIVLDAERQRLDAEPRPAVPTRWATVLRSVTADGPGVTPQRLHWGNDVIGADPDHGYQVRLDSAAFAGIRREVIRMAGERGPAVETGGLLLGQLDHASRVVWVSEAQGLPAGSETSAEGLQLDPAVARAAVQERLVQSRRLVGFIGAWHTHPRHLAVPSVIDQAAMEEMAADNNSPVLLMIIGDNTGDLWQPWIAGSGRPSWYARLYFPR